MMDLKSLISFVAVFEEGGFGRAANRINSTQPALSVRIASLEAELGVELFDRHSRGVTATTAGKCLYARGLQLLQDASSAIDEVRALSGQITGTVTVGIPPTLSRAVLAPILLKYTELYPYVDIRVSEAYSTTLLTLLESQQLDFALVTYVPNHPAIKFERIYQDRFVVVYSSRLDIKPFTPVRLDMEPFRKLVVPSMQHGLHRLLDEPFQTGRITPARRIEIDGLSGALEFVSKTDWVALLPYAAVYNSDKSSNLRFAPLEGDEICIDYFVARPARVAMSTAAVAFAESARLELSKIAVDWTHAPGKTAKIKGSNKWRRTAAPRRKVRARRANTKSR